MSTLEAPHAAAAAAMDCDDISAAVSRLEGFEKEIRCVPRIIDFETVRVQTKDFRVNCYGVDEIVYRNRDIWEALPRGFAEVTVFSKDAEPVPLARTVVLGLRKFGYETDKFGHFDSPDAVREVYSVKENGECMHVGCIKAGHDVFWVVGSKNVHAALRSVEDFPRYETEQRYFFALRMAKLWFALLDTLPAATRSALVDLLSSGITLCGEAYFV
jgi:hypothetical protein